jgi:thiol-disulfide isomerase/thioredoxin
MKNSVSIAFFCLYFSLLFSCQSSTDSSTNEFNDFLNSLKYQNKNKIDVYVVLPVDICPSCIDTYKSFIKDIPSSNVLFILSGNSLKKLRLTFGADLLELDNVLVDEKGLFNNTVFYKDIGQVFYIEESKVIEIKEIGITNLNEELANLTQLAKSKSQSFGRPQKSDSLDDFITGLLRLKEESPYFSHLIGKQLPSFQGTTIKGEYFKLSDFIGKPMVLNFWFINCPNCYEEIPDINGIYNDSKKEDFVFMSFCKDRESTLGRSFEISDMGGYKRKKNQKKDQIIYYDFVPGATDIIDQLNIKAFPVTLTVGKDGKITRVILYTKSFQFPDELITYRLIKAELERIKNGTIATLTDKTNTTK